jgi:RNA polymerase sigma-70 factor (ECF subfamily)
MARTTMHRKAIRRDEAGPERSLRLRDVTETRSDETLMAAIAAGDQVAFSRLVERHLSRTVGLATRLMGARADGEEIAQEAFARVWSHAARWRPIGGGGNARFTTWLYRIVVNLAIDRKRRPALASMDDVEEPIDDADDGFAQIHHRQVSSAVTAAMARLPERQRVALSLCFFEGMSNIEAGKIMSLSVGAVESLLVRARRALRQELSGVYEEL